MPFVLENAELRVEICDPEETNESHLYTRFSHCGYITQIIQKKRGELLLGQPTYLFHPFHGSGFPDEFETPLGYEEAACNAGFLKIGVGVEKKRANTPYSNWDEHPIMQRAKIDVNTMPNGMVFIQSAMLGHIGYHYMKKIELDGRKIAISHNLQNIGNDRWNTLWYSHVFLPIEKVQPRAIMQMNCGGSLKKHLPQMQNDTPTGVTFSTQDLNADGLCFQWDMSAARSNMQLLLNGDHNAVYHAVGNYLYQELQIWMNNRVFSIEPKLHIDLQPGQKKCWETIYTW